MTTGAESSAIKEFVAARAAAKAIILKFEDLDNRIAVLEQKMISRNNNNESSKKK